MSIYIWLLANYLLKEGSKKQLNILPKIILPVIILSLDDHLNAGFKLEMDTYI